MRLQHFLFLCVACMYLEVWDPCSLPPTTHRAGPIMAQGPCGCVQCAGRCPNLQGLSAGYGRRCTDCSRNCTARFGSRLDRFGDQEARAQLGAGKFMVIALGQLQWCPLLCLCLVCLYHPPCCRCMKEFGPQLTSSARPRGPLSHASAGLRTQDEVCVPVSFVPGVALCCKSMWWCTYSLDCKSDTTDVSL